MGDKDMSFEEWLKIRFPGKVNNGHTVYTIKDMQGAFYAGIMHGTQKEEETEMEEEKTETAQEQTAEETVPQTAKLKKAKTTSLIAQIVAALWVAVWCGKKFITANGETSDIILSGFAIAACFCPVYFNMILDKVKSIKFGE